MNRSAIVGSSDEFTSVAVSLKICLLRWIRRLDMTSSVPYQPISPTHAGLQSASFLAILHLPMDDRWIKIALGKPWQNILTTLSTASRSGSEKLWLCLAFFLGLWISLEGFWCLHSTVSTCLFLQFYMHRCPDRPTKYSGFDIINSYREICKSK